MLFRFGAGTLLVLLLRPGEIVEVRDLPYAGSGDSPLRKQQLNLYLPKAKSGFPTVMFIHGGAWREGDRSLFEGLGRRFAEDGIGMAVIGYRLSPGVKHPEHVRDCARAFAWLHQNIAVYGGTPKLLFVMGHSAGAHLAGLLTLDPRYLKEVNLSPEVIRGGILTSGVYALEVPPADQTTRRKIILEAFGDDPAALRDASPVTHVAHAVQPFFVLTELTDTLQLRPSMERLRQAVGKEEKVNLFTFEDAADRTHESVLGKMMALGADPYRLRIEKFVRDRCAALASSK